MLKEKWFSIHEFLADTSISNMKYKHLRSKYKNNFDFFNDQLDNILVYYFTELENTKNNINIFLTDLLIALFTKK